MQKSHWLTTSDFGHSNIVYAVRTGTRRKRIMEQKWMKRTEDQGELSANNENLYGINTGKRSMM